MTDLIVAVIIVIAVVLAVGYIIKQKKKGVKCIGCSSAGVCAHKNSGACYSCDFSSEENACCCEGEACDCTRLTDIK